MEPAVFGNSAGFLYLCPVSLFSFIKQRPANVAKRRPFVLFQGPETAHLARFSFKWYYVSFSGRKCLKTKIPSK